MNKPQDNTGVPPAQPFVIGPGDVVVIRPGQAFVLPAGHKVEFVVTAAAADVGQQHLYACPRCGGSLPTCCRCPREPLTLREEPEELRTRDLVSRTLSFRAATLDDKARSVEAVMATEGQVSVYDWMSGDVIDEVLVADGGSFPDQLPFLDNHSRWSLDNVLGSVRGIRRDGTTWVGRAFFAADDPEADRAWNKVKQGHLRDVSIGYRTTDYQDIPAGTTATVNGRDYTAGARTLRISRRWEAKELSLVPIGADRNTKVRQQPGDPGKGHLMDPVLRKYLESIGLRSDASEADAQAFLKGLGGKHKTRADAIVAKTLTFDAALEQHRADFVTTGTPATQTQPGQGEPQRGAGTTTITTPATPPAHVAGTPTPDQVRQEAVRVERERVTAIRKLAGDDVPPALLTRAESEGWDTARASEEFLTAVREARQPAVGAGSTNRAGEAQRTAQLMGLAMVIRGGEIDDKRIEHTIRRLRLLPGQKWENVAEQADRFRDLSLYEMCQRAIQLDGREVPTGREETVRSAVSGSNLTNIFTTSVNARLMMAWEEAGDSTVGWVDEADVADFKTQDEIDYIGNARLEKMARGATAKNADTEDGKESWRIARYAKKFTVDEQDIVDDNFSILVSMPQVMGAAARRLRPDIVYSLLLANGNLRDGTALFAAGHNNLLTGGGSALSTAALSAAAIAMGKQTRGAGKNVVNLNIAPRYLIVPQDLKFVAAALISSIQIWQSNGQNTTVEFGRNVLMDLNLDLRVDNRIGVAGVLDPVSEVKRVGTATNWFLASAPGRTIKVGYLRGTGRAPGVRSYVLDKGQWGIGWDIKHDVGAVVQDFSGFVKNNGV